MNFLKNIKVGTSLILLVCFMAIVMAAIGFLGISGLNAAHEGLRTVYEDRVVPLRDLKLIADMYAVNIVDTTHKTRNGNIAWEDAVKNVTEAKKTIDEKWKAYQATLLVAEEQRLIAEALPLMKVADSAIAHLLSITEARDAARIADFSIRELYPSIDPISEVFAKLVDVQLVVGKEEYEKSGALYERNFAIAIASIAVGIVVSLALALIIIRRITKPLERAVQIATGISAGDLRLEMDSADRTRQDEIGALSRAFSDMTVGIRKIVMEITSSSKNVSSGAEEISSTAQVLSQGATEQAAAAEEVSSSVEEMGSTIKQNADNAISAEGIARRSAGDAKAGGNSVTETVMAMKDIAGRVGIIEEIARQTNLLAL
ncbi:MAG: methyl-accepting chemotaxis protein, partial [Spirochaetaceae bacterium]|nr:methyl-accepting chemotaxis protein [Spirochaetaceae bacterium]